MLAWAEYQSMLCPGCDQPKETAWHADTDGDWEVSGTFTCHPCTVRKRYHDDQAEPVTYVGVIDTRDYDERPLPFPLRAAPPRDTTHAEPGI